MKSKKLLGIVGLVVLFVVLLAGRYAFNAKIRKPAFENSLKIKVEQKIVYGDRSDVVKMVEALPTETALDILVRTQNVETKTYSIGKLVESIDGLKNGTANKYWIYYVNGAEAAVGASEYKLHEADKIEWRFKAYEQ